jgi:hypothetical protein
MAQQAVGVWARSACTAIVIGNMVQPYLPLPRSPYVKAVMGARSILSPENIYSILGRMAEVDAARFSEVFGLLSQCGDIRNAGRSKFIRHTALESSNCIPGRSGHKPRSGRFGTAKGSTRNYSGANDVAGTRNLQLPGHVSAGRKAGDGSLVNVDPQSRQSLTAGRTGNKDQIAQDKWSERNASGTKLAG